MAIIYTYPNLPLSNLSAEDLLVITNVDATNNNPTRSVTLADIATYVTGTGSGTGTTNKIVKFTDGANGLLGDSIMTESTGLIDLAGQFVSTSSPTLTQGAPVSGIKAILNGTTAAPNVALYGESKNTGSTQADSNYGLFAKGEFEGTAGFTGFVIGGNLEGRYDGTGTNGANATVYGSYNLARATTAANGTVSYMIGANNLAKLEGANVTATNLQGTHSTVELSNGTAGDVIVQILDFDGTGGTVTGDLSYLQIQNDTMPTVAGTSRAIKSLSVLPSLFTGQVEIPLVPTINAHATSKQYVDQQISNVVSGLVFQSTWDASSTPGGNPDLTDASKKVVGHYYVVSVAGSATPNGAGTLPNSWNVGDWCIYVEQGATDRWEKLDQTFVSGAGAAGQVTYWNSQNEVAGDNDLFFDSTNKRLGIGTTSPAYPLDIVGFANSSSGFRVTDGTIDNRISWSSGNVGFFGTISNHPIAFNTNSIERMRIDSAGDIFISPRATAASSGSGILYFKNVDDNSATISGGSIRTVDSTNNPSGADIRFQVANDAGTLFDAVAIDSNGFMGIGTMAPDFLLDVSGSARLNSASINSQDILVLKNGINTVNKYLGISFTTGVGGSGPHGAIRVYNGPSSSDAYMSLLTTTNGGTLTQGLTQDHLGNIGIGTTTPGTKLYISSDSSTTATIEAKNPTAFNDPQLNFITWNEASGSSSGKIQLTNGTFNSNDMAFFTETANSVTEKMRITSAGKVGIGNNNPAATLYVSGSNGDATDKPTMISESVFTVKPVALNSGNLNFAQVDNGSSIGMQYTNGAGTANWNISMQPFGGNVGIGTTSPSEALSLPDDAKIAVGDSADLKIYHNGLSSYIQQTGIGKIIIDSSSTGINMQSGTGETRFTKSGQNSEIKVDDASQTNQIVLKASGNSYFNGGNVGIGTTNPSHKLTISDTTTHTTARVLTTTFNSNLRVSTDNSDFAIIGQGGSNRFDIFDVNGSSTRLSINSSGNVGISNTSPGAKLDVNAGTENLAAQFESTDSISEIRIKDNTAYTRLLNVGTQFKIMPNNGSETLILDGNNDSATFAGKVNVAGSTNNESALNVKTDSGSIGSIGFETGSEVTGIISSQTELMEFRVGDGIGISSAKQLKIDTNGIEVTGDAEITNSSDGLILKSPNGTRYRITIDNSGNLVRTAI